MRGLPPRWRVFAAFAAAHFLSYFLRNTNAVLADDLARDLALSPEQLGLMTSFYLLAFAAAQLPFGSLLDRFGARRTTPALLLAAVAGSALFALGEGFGAAATGRALIGLGTAGVLMGALKALSGAFPARRFGTVSGTLVAFGSLGAVLAAAPLAGFAELFGWRAAFAWSGAAVLAAAAGVAIWGTVRGRGAAAGGDESAGTAAATTAPAAVPAAEIDERAGAAPAGPVPDERGFGLIFGDARFWRMAALAFALGGANSAWQSLWAGPYLTGGIGLDALAAGRVLVGLAAGVTLGFLLSGPLGARFGVARALALAGVGAVAALLALALRPAPGAGLLTALFALFGFTSATGLLLFTQVRSVFPLSHTGRAVTAINLGMFGGGFVQQWLLGVLLGALAGGAAAPPAAAYGALCLASAALVAAALLLYLPELRAARAGSR